jgi:sulfur-carrier protein adenylyltransferase/sulfurtransferase
VGSWQQTRIAVIGCGGLGVPGAWALLAGGVEKLLLVDNDVVDASNLHRQVLYPEATVGEPKADVLARVLKAKAAAAGRHLDVQIRAGRVEPANTELMLNGCDAVLEGSDDAVCKFAVNDWAVSDRAGRNVRVASIAAAIGRRGQWMTVAPSGACYRCLFEEPPPAELLSSCQIAGVLGPVVAQVGALAARSLLRVLQGRPDAAGSALVRRSPRGLQVTSVQPEPACRCQRGWRACG